MLSNSQFKVYDFNAAKIVKNRTGRAAAIQMSNTPDSPEMTKHEDEALAIHNKPDSKVTKAAKWLGLLD